MNEDATGDVIALQHEIRLLKVFFFFFFPDLIFFQIISCVPNNLRCKWFKFF